MIVAIVGSRGWEDTEAVRKCVTALGPGDSVVSGGAFGADSLAEAWCLMFGVPCRVVQPDYAIHGRRAPLVRNEEIAKSCDRMVAFWDDKSRGTAHAIKCARSLGKSVDVITSARLG